MVYRQLGLAQDNAQDFRLNWMPGMDRHHYLLPRPSRVPQCRVAANLMIHVPTCPAQRSDEAVPGNIPGKFAQTATSTIASVMVLSSGIGSPCFFALSM